MVRIFTRLQSTKGPTHQGDYSTIEAQLVSLSCIVVFQILFKGLVWLWYQMLAFIGE